MTLLLRGFGAVLALALLGLSSLGSAAAKADSPAPLLVFAASSLAGVLEPVLALTTEGAQTRISFGASGALARQIEAGAEVDLFISANHSWAEYLTGKKLANQSRAKDIVSNKMVIVRAPLQGGGGKLAINDLKSLPDGQRLAMGDPAYVPAGAYGKGALQWYGVWEDLKSKLVLTNSARGALALVARGEVPYALVYKTDARAAGLEIALTLAAESHPQVIYRAVPIEGKRPNKDRRARTDKLVAELTSPKVQSQFADLGFDQLR